MGIIKKSRVGGKIGSEQPSNPKRARDGLKKGGSSLGGPKQLEGCKTEKQETEGVKRTFNRWWPPNKMRRQPFGPPGSPEGGIARIVPER